MNKIEMRKSILEKRKSMMKNKVKEKSCKIFKHLISTEYYNKAQAIMVYIDFRNEVSTEELIKHSIMENKKVIIPISIVETKELLLSQLYNYDTELTKGSYGILEPKKEFVRKVSPQIIDLVLIPGVCFDRRGYRIGYGGGYYDRFLCNLRNNVAKIALAFDLQLVEKVPYDTHDIPVDHIITENDIINCQ